MVRHGLLTTLVELFCFSPDIDISRLSGQIINQMCKNEVILTQVFETIKIGDLVSKMFIDKDL